MKLIVSEKLGIAYKRALRKVLFPEKNENVMRKTCFCPYSLPFFSAYSWNNIMPETMTTNLNPEVSSLRFKDNMLKMWGQC